MQQCGRFSYLPTFVMGIVLGTIGLGFLTSALADAGDARLSTNGYAVPDRDPQLSPALVRQTRYIVAPIGRPEPNRHVAGAVDRSQAAGKTSIPQPGERRRFLYRTAAVARKLPWVEVQTGTPRTYVAAQVPPEFQMLGSMSPNP